MSVYRPKDSPYYKYDFRRNRIRFHKSTRKTSEVEAKKVEREAKKQAVAEGPKGRKRILLLRDACARYIEEHAIHIASAKTIGFQTEALVAGIGERVEFSKLGDADISEYIAKRRAKVSDSTVNREVSCLRAIWRRARDQWAIEVGKEPNWRAHRLKEPQERRRYLTEEEKTDLLAKIRPDYRALVVFALLTGARVSSVRHLKWDDVNYATREIRLAKVKGGGSQVLPLTDALITLLANERGHHHEHVFTYENNRRRKDHPKGERRPFSLNGWRKAWKAALKAASIENCRFHDLRHTAATEMLRATGNIATVQRVLGHSSITTTQRYAHVLLEDQRAALESLSLPKSKNESQTHPESHSSDEPTSKKRA